MRQAGPGQFSTGLRGVVWSGLAKGLKLGVALVDVSCGADHRGAAAIHL
jgi:hypothetical protein